MCATELLYICVFNEPSPLDCVNCLKLILPVNKTDPRGYVVRFQTTWTAESWDVNWAKSKKISEFRIYIIQLEF